MTPKGHCYGHVEVRFEIARLTQQVVRCCIVCEGFDFEAKSSEIVRCKPSCEAESRPWYSWFMHVHDEESYLPRGSAKQIDDKLTLLAVIRAGQD